MTTTPETPEQPGPSAARDPLDARLEAASASAPAPGRVRLPREQRRRQLLDAAARVFGRTSFHTTVMDDIAEAAGVSKPVLYQHFTSKMELYLALLDKTSADMIEHLRSEVAQHQNNRELVRAAIRTFYRFVGNENSGYRFLFESDLTAEPEVQERIWAWNRDAAATIADVIVRDTAVDTERARLLGISVVGLAQLSSRWWVQEDDKAIDVEEAIDLVASLAWRGLRSLPTS